MAPLDRYLYAPYAMRRYADLTGHALEDRRHKIREAAGVLRCGPHGQRGDPRRGLYGQFAGILQVEIRQWVSRVRMLMSVLCEGNNTFGNACRATHGPIGMPSNTDGSPSHTVVI